MCARFAHQYPRQNARTACSATPKKTVHLSVTRVEQQHRKNGGGEHPYVSDETLLDAIKEYEQIDIELTKSLSCVSFASDTKLDDYEAQKRKASLFQRYSTINGNELTFFGLELADMPQEKLDAQLASTPELSKYSAYIDEVRRSQPYNLSKEVERALTVRAVSYTHLTLPTILLV